MSSTTPVQPRAFALENSPLPFSRSTWFRWERQRRIKLLRIGGKTLVSAETIDDILSGKIALPHNPGHVKAPQPRARRRKDPKPEHTIGTE
jgi:hypothetical protein